MINALVFLAATALLLAALALLNVSSPNYAAVLSSATVCSALAAVLFWVSSLSASGVRQLALRAVVVIAVVVTCYSAWGAVSALN